MYYIIHKQLYMAETKYFYLTAFDEKQHLVTYNPHIEDAMKFDTCADAVMFILNAPETIAVDMMTIPEI